MATDNLACFVVFIALAVPLSCVANTRTADQQAVEFAIRSQLEAFQTGDEQAAYALASPGIKRHFPNVDQFMEMVKTSYQAVYRPQSIKFLHFMAEHTPPIQHLIVIDPSGQAWDAYYLMEKTEETVELKTNSAWRIAGVKLNLRNERAI